ncbi:hypothetical protein [Cupriavidus sp. BIC8F]|uniref:hypothetical protein n=1 Tax=Cupriavidus sp. BIC8F TaxID=3079014 RepID=UPI002916CC8F|nr:hypothetical protein [Cupriavidus sp. BIC8F]
MSKKVSTKAESAYMGRVKQMACICCTLLGRRQESITDVHHIREGQGGAQRAGNYLVLPLCHDDCHTGKNGVHGDKTYLRILKMNELDLLDAALALLNGGRL